MAQELETDIAYQQVVGISRRLEGMLTREREEREAKRSRKSSTYSGVCAPVASLHGRGYESHPVRSALPAFSDIPATPRPQAPYYAPPLSSASSTLGAFSGQSSRSGSSHSQQPRPPRACFEGGDTCHMVRDFPRFRRGVPLQTTQAPRIPPGPQASQSMVTVPAATLPARPTRGGVQAGRGRPRGGGHARYYALPSRTEVVSFDSVITSIVLFSHKDASVLFDPGSTYSYVSSYFALYLGVSHDSLSCPVYVATPAQRMVKKWSDVYLAYVRDVSVDTPTVESILVVRDYPDIFPVDLPGMPPDRDIDFGIDLLSSTQPISIPPYRMAPADLKRLKDQLQELLDKGFIRPTVSPWDSMAFLGHVVSSEGIKVDPKEIEVVQSWPRLSSTMEIQSFLGLAGYYRRFEEGFSSIATPMTRLTQKGAPLRWTEKCEDSFQKLKITLTTTLVLVLPSGLRPYTVYCDASRIGLRGVDAGP
ncbi:uncharacterized protein [Nicotiana tomentosiformis]|uniref:uncharacterized protein n=1 Tax=Nicotiana tomentosiformis TaxID=4098 RepID=UPI00388C69F2